MPLFMLLSGLFFEKSASMPLGGMFKKRYLQWVLPATFFAAVLAIPSLFEEDGRQLAEVWLKRVIYPAPYWYVTALLFCVIVSSVFYKLFRGRLILAALVSTVPVLLLPDISFVLTPDYKFMLPYFWLGAIMMRYSGRFTKEWVIASVSLLLFAVMFCMQRDQCFIYSSSFSDITIKLFPFSVIYGNPLNVAGMVSLYGLGLFGSVALFFTLKSAYPYIKRFMITGLISYIGKNTLGIYFISICVNSYFSDFVSFPAKPEWIYDLVYTIAYSVLTIFLCLVIINCIKRSGLLSKLFLGIYQ